MEVEAMTNFTTWFQSSTITVWRWRTQATLLPPVYGKAMIKLNNRYPSENDTIRHWSYQSAVNQTNNEGSKNHKSRQRRRCRHAYLQADRRPDKSRRQKAGKKSREAQFVPTKCGKLMEEFITRRHLVLAVMGELCFNFVFYSSTVWPGRSP